VHGTDALSRRDRPRLILLRPEGLSWAQIRAQLDCGDHYIARWSHRIAPDRLAALFARFSARALHSDGSD
jgi:hypothetical protein